MPSRENQRGVRATPPCRQSATQLAPKPPTYLRRALHGRDVAYIRLRCRTTRRVVDVILGDYGSPESREAYAAELARWEAAGRRLPGPAVPKTAPSGQLSIEQLLATFVESDTWEAHDIRERQQYRIVARLIRRAFGPTPAIDFGPNALRQLRAEMIRGDTVSPPPGPDGKVLPPRRPWSARYASSQVGRIKRIFRWAVARELLPEGRYHALQALEPMRLPPHRPKSLSADRIEAVKPHVSAQVWAMIELQRLTGMRPSEVCTLRPCDIDRAADVWEYRPQRHKSQWRGKPRVVMFGPQAQAVLAPFLLRPAEAYCFSPAEAVDEMHQQRAERRETPAGLGNEPGTNRRRRPKRKPHDHYVAGSYGRAVARACAAAQIEHWTPYQLRHTAATQITRAVGLEAASVILGHCSALMTDAVYADRDLGRAREVAKRIG